MQRGLNSTHPRALVPPPPPPRTHTALRPLYNPPPQSQGGAKTRVRCGAVVIATGLGVANKPKQIEGIDLVTGYESLPETGESFQDQAVAVLGMGNAAMETADSLSEWASYVHIYGVRQPPPWRGVRDKSDFVAWESRYVGNVRAVNAQPLDSYMLKSLDGGFGTLHDMLVRPQRSPTCSRAYCTWPCMHHAQHATCECMHAHPMPWLVLATRAQLRGPAPRLCSLPCVVSHVQRQARANCANSARALLLGPAARARTHLLQPTRAAGVSACHNQRPYRVCPCRSANAGAGARSCAASRRALGTARPQHPLAQWGAPWRA